LRYFKIQIVFLFLFFYSNIGVAQQLLFENNKQIQLPSLECYKVFQDKKGYIWLATELGFYKYDGVSQKRIDLKSNTINEAVYFIWENKKGQLCVTTSKNRFLYIQNDVAFEFPFSNSIYTYISNSKKERQIIYHCVEDENENLKINTNYGTYSYNYKTKICKSHTIKSEQGFYKLTTYKNQFFLQKNDFVQHKNTKNLIQKYILEDNDKTALVDFEFHSIKYEYNNYQFIKIKDDLFFSLGNILFKKSPGKKTEYVEMPNVILNLYSDRNNGLWVGLFKNGVYYYDNPSNLKNPSIQLEEFSVSNILVDRENNVWCSTLEKGIFICRNKGIVIHTNKEDFKKPAMILNALNKKIFFISSLKQLHVFENDKQSEVNLNLNKVSEYTDLIWHNNHYYIANKSFVVRTKDFKNFEHITNLCTYNFAKINHRLFFLGIGEVNEIVENRILLFCKDDRLKGTSITNLGNKHLVVGTKKGLYKIAVDTKKVEPFKGFDYPVSKLFTVKNTIYIGTKGVGLWKLENGVLSNITKNTSFQNNYITDITRDENNIIWISTTEGILKLTEGDYGFNLFKITTQDGVLDNYCNRITSSNNKLFVSTSEGLFSFAATTTFNKNVAPKLYLKSALVNDKPIIVNDKIVNLDYDQNNISLCFDVLSYKNNNIQLVYKLEPKDQKLKTTSTRTINFENLSPGTYSLTAFAQNKDNIKSEDEFKFNFIIKKPFWKTNLFIVLISFFVLMTVYFFVFKIIQKVKRKEFEKTQINKLIAESQLKALQAQMNPHFIFNAINSIQKYVLNNQKEEAYNYLTKFSKLIRIVLQNSENQIISIKEEIELLQLYISIEKLRFDQQFKFELDIDTALESEHFFIPSMLLQPYVENAIWHGLVNLENERDPMLKITIKLKNNFIKVSIEDNGIGREKANSFKKNNYHNSLGTMISEKRIDLLKKTKEFRDIKVKIIDLYIDTLPVGTKVLFYIPQNLY
jgi:ligand-binding sensor domain-containing protein